MLIHNNPPPVSADTHDHAGRRPNTNDAALVHTPIASNATSTGDPLRHVGTTRRQAPAPTARNARRSPQPAPGTAPASP